LFLLKAIVISKFGGPNCLEYKEIAVLPEISENQVLIKVKATSINFADIKKRNGTYPGEVQLPFIPGLDASGIIAAIGEKVSHLEVGQKVIAFPSDGSYAEYIVADEAVTFPIPESMCLEKAAAFPIVAFASYNLLKDVARVQQGESILMHAGSGGVGTTAIQFAKLFGCKNIIASVGSEHKEGIAKEVGADYVINYNDKNLSKNVLNITEGKGVDVILDSLGGEVFTESMKCLAPFGRLVYYGNASRQSASLDIDLLYPSNRMVMGYSLGAYRKFRPHQLKETAKQVLPYLEKNLIKIVISKKYSLKDAAIAHEWIESRQSIGKVLLIP
jgi:NADPH2:quinone reductase